jgi:cysteine desulfurase/selenocysteine lyase
MASIRRSLSNPNAPCTRLVAEVATTTRIYLDNAATSWPKPDVVYDAVDRYQRTLGAPAGRSAYREAVEVERLVQDARRQIAQLIGVADSKRIIFTHNGTDSLNIAISGTLRRGDHVVTTVMEHNSVLRPLRHLENHLGITVSRVPCGADGIVDADEIRRAVQPTTRMIAVLHASNVTGAIQPVAEIGRIAKEHNCVFLVDAAQSLGHVPFQADEFRVDLLAAPGHKGLMGPLGTGILYLAPGMEQVLQPTRWGGTGTHSENDIQPDSLPDRFESGNHNVVGIVGLGPGVGYLRQKGLEQIREHERQLTQRLLDGFRSLQGVTIYGPCDSAKQTGVVSISAAEYDPQELASLLDSAYGIQVRSGLHCAPLMHQSLHTAERGGTVRFSVGPFNTTADIDTTIQAIEEITSAT